MLFSTKFLSEFARCKRTPVLAKHLPDMDNVDFEKASRAAVYFSPEISAEFFFIAADVAALADFNPSNVISALRMAAQQQTNHKHLIGDRKTDRLPTTSGLSTITNLL